MSSLTHRLILQPAGQQADIPHDTSLLDAARTLGVALESTCGGRQTCGKCQIVVQEGDFPREGITSAAGHLSPPTESERACAREAGFTPGVRRLACAARLRGDALVVVPGDSLARKQVVRKAAGTRTVAVDPAVRVYYVKLLPPELGDAADWSRLRAALAEQWGLPEALRIDPVVLRALPEALRTGRWAVTVAVGGGGEVVRVAPGYNDERFGLAVDVGSTTIALHLCDLRTGEVLATESAVNPQVRYGEDLMSRITYAMQEPGGAARLRRAVIRALNELTARAAESAGVDSAAILDMVLVGNTVMHHLLLGIDPTPLGTIPFALAVQDPLDLKARDLGLTRAAPAATVHLLPCVAGFVGADNVGVLLAEQPDLDDRVSLIIDIGTNAELLLGTRDRMLAASSPTGPALEGAHIRHGQRAAPGAIERVRVDHATGRVRYRVIGDARWSDALPPDETLQPTGICGSGIIEAVAELFLAGIITNSGRFAPDAAQRSPAMCYSDPLGEFVLAPAEQTATGQDIVITQRDIRAIQLAKGALYAGAKLLMERFGVERVDRVRLAGAFGSVIDPWHALVIGMIPDCDLAQIDTVGNAAGDGARLALLNMAQRRIAHEAARDVEYVETGGTSSFQDLFVAAMVLPHATDAFPHLSRDLPAEEKEDHHEDDT